MKLTSSSLSSPLSRHRKSSRRRLSRLTTAPTLAALLPLLLPACAPREPSPPGAAVSGVALTPGASPDEHPPSSLAATDADFVFVALSDEQGIDEPLVSASIGLKIAPAAAFANGTYLVVWEDHRERPPLSGPFTSPTPHLFAARLAPDGTMLDPEPLLLGRGHTPTVTTNGSAFLVAYKGILGSACTICAQRVGADGTLLDDTPRAVVGETGGEVFGAPALAWNGTVYLAAWPCGISGVCTRGVTPAGTVVPAASSFVIHPSAPEPDPLRLASDGAGFFLATWTATGLVGVRLDAAGQQLASPITLSPPPPAGIASGPLDLAFDGTCYVAAWSHGTAAGTWPVWARRISPAGALLDPSPLVLHTDADPASAYPKRVAASGQAGITHVFWEEHQGDAGPLAGPRFRARLEGTAGTLLDPAPTPVGEGRGLALASDGQDDLLVSLADRPGSLPDPFTRVMAQRVAPSGALLDPAPLSTTPGENAQVSPALAWNGQHHLAVWSDSRTGQRWSLHGARLSATGAPLDAAAFPLDPTPSTRDDLHPRVASDGTGFRVAWRRTGDGTSSCDGHWTTARVDAQGTPTAPTPLPALSTCRDVLLGGHPAGALAIGTNEDGDVDFAIPFDPATGPGAPVTLAVARPSEALPVALSFDGANHLVVWADGQNLLAARVTPAGQAVDTEAFPIFSVGPDFGIENDGVAIAFDGVNHIVVSSSRDLAPYSSNRIFHKARVSPAGVVLDPGGVPRPYAEPCLPPKRGLQLSFDGEHLILLHRAGSVHVGQCGIEVQTGEFDTPSSDPWLRVSESEVDSGGTALTSPAHGQTLLLTSRYVDEPALRTHRIRARVLTTHEWDGGGGSFPGGAGSTSGAGSTGGTGGVGGAGDPGGVGGAGGSGYTGNGGAGGGEPGTPGGGSSSTIGCSLGGLGAPTSSSWTFSALVLALAGLLARTRASARTAIARRLDRDHQPAHIAKHVNPPSMLTQMSPAGQSSISREHSSISVHTEGSCSHS
ncbi:Hypothetical protein CAP_3760 [Chondromyces apiculatus DSM 436]|uniref:Uncharacterized protein n=1 Tax=Chondromyces apiculatus DSM 436 TaxID=1192034 RepID=A0A017T6V0_9BACT|nr:hypothetical protein [Chondromyces apiculatus]EYF04949.1 Hypothetical protein CAP_3760 [Chondromyces apiculatus DSM 436]